MCLPLSIYLLCMCTEIQKFLPFFVMNDKGIKKKKNKYQLGNECMNKLTRNAKYGCIQTTFKWAQVSMQDTWTKWENWHKPISVIKRMLWCMSNVLDSYITQCQNLRLIGVQMTMKISLVISLNTWRALLFEHWGITSKSC